MTQPNTPVCECCLDQHVRFGGVVDDFDGGRAVVAAILSTGEHRCGAHRVYGRRSESGAGFEPFDPSDVTDIA